MQAMTTISTRNISIISGSNGHSSSDLVVRFPGPGDRDALSELGRRVGGPVPTGSVLVAEQDGRVVAAAPLDGGPPVSESTAEAESAVAVLRFRIHQLRHGVHPAWVSERRRGTAHA